MGSYYKHRRNDWVCVDRDAYARGSSSNVNGGFAVLGRRQFVSLMNETIITRVSVVDSIGLGGLLYSTEMHPTNGRSVSPTDSDETDYVEVCS